jgi:DNA topoisomerase-1
MRAGRGFRYVTPFGRSLRDPADLARIRAMAIPPAWRDVWICCERHGHLQATGRDARGRKQYRYHHEWRVIRDQTKYGNMIAFGSALPALRARVAADLAAAGLGKQKVVAAVVQLLERTLIRVGNDEYVRTNGSFGLTTMRNDHVAISGSTLRFRFKGKSGKVHDVEFNDRRLARVVRQCRDLPGHELFQFVGDDGRVHDIGSADVNAYVRETMARDFTAKDFRTWTGTVLAAHALRQLPPFKTKVEITRNIRKAVEAVGGVLGNTPTVCRNSYIHPAIVDGYMDGSLLRSSLTRVGRDGGAGMADLDKTEAAVLRLLKKRTRAAQNS